MHGEYREPVVVRPEACEICCFCGRETDYGIFVRVDPAQFPRRREVDVSEEAYIAKQRAGLDGVGGRFDPLAEELECLDGPEGCQGNVEYRMPLSPSGRAFPRCDHHWSFSWRSDVPPAWFDATACGERWEDD
jgi:hypothetical protein